jgi:hypothetical protein
MRLRPAPSQPLPLLLPSPPLSPLPIAVRAYTPRAELQTTADRPIGVRSGPVVPDLVLVLDTETTVDATQRLLFGNWRVRNREGHCLDEGLFYGDDLSSADLAILREYVRTHAAATPTHLPEPLRLLSRRAFLRQVLWPVAYKARGLVVGFNLPFDLARIGVGWGATRSAFYAGGLLPYPIELR